MPGGSTAEAPCAFDCQTRRVKRRWGAWQSPRRGSSCPRWRHVGGPPSPSHSSRSGSRTASGTRLGLPRRAAARLRLEPIRSRRGVLAVRDGARPVGACPRLAGRAIRTAARDRDRGLAHRRRARARRGDARGLAALPGVRRHRRGGSVEHGMGPVGHPRARLVPSRIGTALGIASAGIGVGIFALVPLAQLLIDRIGWQWAFRVLGLLVVGWVIPAAALLLRDPPRRDPSAPDRTATEAHGSTPHWTLAAALQEQRTPTEWSIASSFVRRPAPRCSAAMPTAIAPRRTTEPARGARTSFTTDACGSAAGRDHRPAPGSSARRRRAPSRRRRPPRRSPPLVLVDPEVGEREQPRARVEDELREVRRPLAADRVARLGDLERVADGGAERLVHVREQADDLAARVLAELEHRLGRALARRRASS